MFKINKDISSGEPDFAKQVISFLNQQVGSKFKPESSATQRLIKARQNDGFTFKDFESVIQKKASQWKNDSEMSKFLRPQTLFGTKFESYLNESSNSNEYKPSEAERFDRKKRCEAANQKFEKSIGLVS